MRTWLAKGVVILAVALIFLGVGYVIGRHLRRNDYDPGMLVNRPLTDIKTGEPCSAQPPKSKKDLPQCGDLADNH